MMIKSLRVAALTSLLALAACPVFADPGGTDPPPPPPGQMSGANVILITSILSSLGL